MRIILDKIGKYYNDEWIFRHLSFEFNHDEHFAIIGPNGSGKSTLLNIISSRLSPDEGKIIFETDNKILRIEDAYKQISFCSSYIELIEEFTLKENIDFYISFKKLINNNTAKDIMNCIGFDNAHNKKLHQFSSGMKQKVKLAFALFAEAPVVLLDEPCTNLDAESMNWYKDLAEKYSMNRTIIVGSNEQEHEYFFCKRKLHIPDFK